MLKLYQIPPAPPLSFKVKIDPPTGICSKHLLLGIPEFIVAAASEQMTRHRVDKWYYTVKVWRSTINYRKPKMIFRSLIFFLYARLVSKSLLNKIWSILNARKHLSHILSSATIQYWSYQNHSYHEWFWYINQWLNIPLNVNRSIISTCFTSWTHEWLIYISLTLVRSYCKIWVDTAQI